MQGECKLGAGASENHFGAPKFGTSVVLKISGFCTLIQILMYICGIQKPEIYGSMFSNVPGRSGKITFRLVASTYNSYQAEVRYGTFLCGSTVVEGAPLLQYSQEHYEHM